MRTCGKIIFLLLVGLSLTGVPENRLSAQSVFRIPAAGMMPTLMIGDFVWVDDDAYDIDNPANESEENTGPLRGDVIIFRYPRNENQIYIKRVVGLPGDHVAYYQRRLRINGVMLETIPEGIFEEFEEAGNANQGINCNRPGAGCESFVEILGEKQYRILLNPSRPLTVSGEVIVPEGQYFVLGDNRDHSYDSRSWGFVPMQNILGKGTWIEKSEHSPDRVGPIQ
jgi:signal peptidase I